MRKEKKHRRKKKPRSREQRNRELKKNQQQGKKNTTTQKNGRKNAVNEDDSSIITSSVSYFSKNSRGLPLNVSLDRISLESGDGHEDEADETENTDVATQAQIEDESINKYFAVAYTEPKKQHYRGKVTKVSEMMTNCL